MEDGKNLERLRHSAAHVLAAAVMRLYPEAKYDVGPAIDNGFYYDFDLSHKITVEDLPKIEAEMRKIIKENQSFKRIEMSREDAMALFEKKGQSYKLERLSDIPEGDIISVYNNGEFEDLCRGPHVRWSKEIKAIKLLSVAGCYYRGDSSKQQMQRIYGTAFASKTELEEHLKKIELAKERDHRQIGEKLHLFKIDEMVGQGLALWTANGTILRRELENFIKEELDKQGYVQVITPHIGKLELFRTSGHFPYYKDSQFSPILDKQEWESLHERENLEQSLDDKKLDGFLLKPMNCPMHARLYATQQRSYKELPIRMAEFGTVYRWEQSGELSGLTRVRGFTQDDAHIFCTEDQIKQEIMGCLKIVNVIFSTLGMEDYRVRVSLRDKNSDKYIGGDQLWDKAESALIEAAKELNKPFTEEVGEAAFYGPKIDFIVKDAIGREWQLGTVQVDYNLPHRFKLSYINSENKASVPIMIHRAPFGSLERFCGLLIEHFAGNFPLWLAPEQVRLLPLNDDMLAYAEEIKAKLQNSRIRVSIDDKSDKLGAKIRRSEVDKIPYCFVLGKKEQEENKVSVRSRINPNANGAIDVDAIVQQLREEIITRKLPANQG